MRWIWIDRFLEFEPGKRAVAVKNVSMAEEHLHDHWEPYPIMPASLMIEGMAQTAGILVGQARDFKEKVILAKISKARFDDIVTPGDQITFEAEIETITEDAAVTSGKIRKNGQPFGEVNIMFSHIDQSLTGTRVPKENFVFTGRFERMIEQFLPGSGPAPRRGEEGGDG
ncbi:MAG: beta-hydroxyacyl-ACP dehydratase [Phycisphaerae bacterium]|nr:beta-hydroxyacyl-ACP dehydratase [Phycisphaerae bacterium]